MASYGASYHIHVTQVPAGLHPGLRVHVNRTLWQGHRPTVSASLLQLSVGDHRIEPGTPLEQALACVELARDTILTAMHEAEADAPM